MKKRLIAVVLVLVLLLSLAACGGSDKILGKWNLDSLDFMGTTMNLDDLKSLAELTGQEADLEMYIDFSNDGKFKMAVMDDEAEGTWKADGSKYTLSVDGDSIEASIEDGKLVLEVEGQKMVFKK